MIKTAQKEIDYQVLHLASWPPLPDLFEDAAPHMIRICALLARRPSVGILIPVMLDIPPPLAHSLLKTLLSNGNIYPVPTLAYDQTAPPCTEQISAHGASETLPFVVKLWKHLIRKT